MIAAVSSLFFQLSISFIDFFFRAFRFHICLFALSLLSLLLLISSLLLHMLFALISPGFAIIIITYACFITPLIRRH
jgi:hypothetical protein